MKRGNDAALKISNLTVNYERTSALWDVSLEIPQGQLVAILGPNGGGKSTLLKAALGLVKRTSGLVHFFGSPLKEVKKQIAYVPQRESVDWDFPLTVFDLVLMGRYGHLGLFRSPKEKDRQIARYYLEKVGMDHLAKRQIGQLSGGQQQRAFLARALSQEADLYFMDEPFVGIDATSSRVIVEILQQLKEKGKTVFVVHHDLSSVRGLYDWVVLLSTRLVASGPVQDAFTPEMIHRAFGKNSLFLDELIQLEKEKMTGFPQ